MPKWTVEASEYVIQHRYLTARKDTCRTDTGHVIDPYFVLEFPNNVVAVAFDPAGNLLVARQYRHGLGKEVSELISGGIEEKDLSPESGAMRELLEETGYTSQKAELIGAVAPNPANVSCIAHVVVLRDCYRLQDPEDNPWEQITFKFIRPEDVLPMIFSGEFCQAVHISAFFMAMSHIGSLALTQP